ncbi:AaceriAFR479Wp [[Ashbya] aceris (nom. inval.)]|nr:AaceriAFR479Wp [[Ashbya] aceris (nom. inval.)]
MLVAGTDMQRGAMGSWSGALSNFVELLDPIASQVHAYRRPSNEKKKAPGRDSRLHFRHRFKRSRGDLTPQLEAFKRKTLQKILAMDKPLQSIFFHNSSALDKAFYTFTLGNIFAIGFMLGKLPEYFHVYYTLTLTVLMFGRFYTYYKTNNHYFLADLCYFVNGLCLIYIWVLPQSVHLYQTCFAFSFGTLSFAVITWRNSLVIHSLDKITSCFIHISPPLTMYAIRHLVDESYKVRRFPAASQAMSPSWILTTNVFYTSVYYLIWQSLYHYFITLRKQEKIKAGERMTSFEYLTTHNFKDLWVLKLPAPWPMVLYTLFQYLYQLSSMILCVLWFKYKYAAGMFLGMIFLIASRNGASYYIDYYGKRFEKEVRQLKTEVESLTQQLTEKYPVATPGSEVFEDSDVPAYISSDSEESCWETEALPDAE